MPSTRLLFATCLASTAFAAIGPTDDFTISNEAFSPNGLDRQAVLVNDPTIDLEITNAVISPDGFERQAIVVNGNSPGPLLSAKKGDEFSINVINLLTDESEVLSTSVHWHGIFQRNHSWADGVSGVTQCPIAPNNSFLYSFPTGDQAGTFWYHSHYQLQYCDGLRGPLVIYDPNDPQAYLYDVDDGWS